MHATELVVRGGHQGAFCTFVNEVGHKQNIKKAAQLSRTFNSRNESQTQMLGWVCRHKVWDAAIRIARQHVARASPQPTQPPRTDRDGPSSQSCTPPASPSSSPEGVMLHTFKGDLLPHMDDWYDHGPPFQTRTARHNWETEFICKRVRVTRRELITILCNKLHLDPDSCNRDRLVTQLEWNCFGSLRTHVDESLKRKFVGISSISPERRDFVRINAPPEDGTCLTAQILMFVELVGFTTDGIVLPHKFRNPPTNDTSVIFALSRWLSPHPNAILRDDRLRPIAPSPFDINHALWTFSKNNRGRGLLSTSTIEKQLGYYDGDSQQERTVNAELERHAVFDLLEPETFKHFVNCTLVDSDGDTIMETITLPF